MSHFTTVETEIRDIDALRDACAELGVTLEEDAIARGYADKQLPAPYVIRLNGPYDVAVTREGRSYSLTTDWWNGHVERELGPRFGKLNQLYATHKMMREARKRGHRVRRRNNSDGTISLNIQGGGWNR